MMTNKSEIDMEKIFRDESMSVFSDYEYGEDQEL